MKDQPKPPKAAPGFGELSEEEKAELTAAARAQVEKDLREQRKKEFLRQEMARFKREVRPGEKMTQIVIDVAGHSDRIVLDGKAFFHGVLYTVTENQARTIQDIMARTWEHEYEVGGANRDIYRAPTHAIISPSNPNGIAGAHRPLPVVTF